MVTYHLFDESAPDSSGAVSYGSGLFYCNLAIISYYDIVGFVDGDRSIISEDRQHCYAHAEIRGQETVAEDGFEFIVVGSGILDACHRLNWGKR